MAPNIYDLLSGRDNDDNSESQPSKPQSSGSPRQALDAAQNRLPQKQRISKAPRKIEPPTLIASPPVDSEGSEGFLVAKGEQRAKPKPAPAQTSQLRPATGPPHNKLPLHQSKVSGKPATAAAVNPQNANQGRPRDNKPRSTRQQAAAPTSKDLQTTGPAKLAVQQIADQSLTSAKNITKSSVPNARVPRYAATKLPPQRLSDEPNVQAVAEWRAKKPPTLRYELPRNFDPRIQSKDVVLSRTGRAFPMFDHLAAKTGTYIVPVMPQSGGGLTIVNIWGTAQAANEAVHWIKWWIWQTFPPSKSKKNFPKIPSLSYDDLWYIEEAAKLDEYKQQFRQALSPDKTFAWRCHVKVPNTSWSLKEVLGNGYEALDSIRTDCHCYITYFSYPLDEDLDGTFRILGNNKLRVKKAAERLFGIFKQQDVRQQGRVQWWMVKQCKTEAMKQLVRLEAYQGPSPLTFTQSKQSSNAALGGTAAKPLLAGPIPDNAHLDERAELLQMSEPGSVHISSDGKVHQTNLRNIEAIVMTALQTLPYYRGYLRMRASLGQGVLTKYPRTRAKTAKLEYGLEEFEKLLYIRNREENQLEGHITKELGDVELEDVVLQKFQRATDVLIPCDAGSAWSGDFKPVYCATFVIADQNMDGIYYQLEVEYQEKREGSGFERTKRLWLRLETATTTMTPLLDINVIDLEGGLSQHLGITAAHAVDDARLPEHYHDFVREIDILGDIAAEPKDTRAFFRWPLKHDGTATVPIISMQQRRAWRFTFLTTDYVVEVATMQDAEWSMQTGKPVAYEMRWGVSMWHAQWDMWLPENAHIGLGEEAAWKPDEWFLFPSEEPVRQRAANTKKSSGSMQKPSQQEEDDLEANAMLFHAGSGFQTLMNKLTCLEEIIARDSGLYETRHGSPVGDFDTAHSADDSMDDDESNFSE